MTINGKSRQALATPDNPDLWDPDWSAPETSSPASVMTSVSPPVIPTRLALNDHDYYRQSTPLADHDYFARPPPGLAIQPQPTHGRPQRTRNLPVKLRDYDLQ